MRTLLKKAVLALSVLALLEGCSAQQMAVRLAYPLVDGQYRSVNEESDPDLARQAIPANLKMMEGMLKSDENNADLLDRLAEGFCGYAFSFVEDDDPRRASALYSRGRDYALRSLAVYPGVARLLDLDPEEFKSALQKIDAVPGLFWLAQCWAGWLNLNLDKPEALAQISRLEAAIQRVAELDETYHYAGPHLLLGGFYGGRTRLLGGNPEKARFHFERNLELNHNKFLLAYVLYAKTYAVQTQDRDLFERLLRNALETPSDVLPEQRLANEAAKIKANKLMEMADELF